MKLDEIIALRDQKQTELTELTASQAIVAEEYGNLGIAIARLDLQRKEIGQGLIKSRSRIKILGLEIEQLKNAYFNARTP